MDYLKYNNKIFKGYSAEVHKCKIIKGTMDNIVIFKIEDNEGNADFIIDVIDYFKWLTLRDRKNKLEKLKMRINERCK
jgi:hypothetical protein